MNLQTALDLSLNDALKISRRLSRATSDAKNAHRTIIKAQNAALALCRELKKLGAQDVDDKP